MDQSGIFPHAHQPETEVDTQRDNCQTRETQSEVRWEVRCQDSGDPEHFSFFLMWPWGRWGLIIQTPPKSTIQIHASPAQRAENRLSSWKADKGQCTGQRQARSPSKSLFLPLNFLFPALLTLPSLCLPGPNSRALRNQCEVPQQ